LHRDRNKTYQEIAKFSKRDADSYLKFAETAMRYLPMLSASLYTPPIPLGAMFALLDQSPEGRELFAYMQRSPYDIIVENFEHEKVQMFFTRMVGKTSRDRRKKAPVSASSCFLVLWSSTALA
jgi:phytoene dehydrogenase-like protein